MNTPLVIDGHGHTLDQAFDTQRHLHEALGGLTDVPLMRAGGVHAQLTACWVPDAAIGGPHASRQPLQKLLQIVDYLHTELDSEAGDHIALATSADDIEGSRAVGKVAFILGLEDGDPLKGDISLLRTLYRLGLRHVGLVHEGRNDLGTATQVWNGPEMRLYDSSIDGPGGLTSAGREFIREMNRLGMLVDVSHMESATFQDTLDVAAAPVIATHGNARVLHDTPRYLDDDQLRAIAATGGLICPSPTPLGPGPEAASLDILLDHIDHMVALVGPDHVGFGTDFLGQVDSRPDGVGDISEVGHLITGLRARGHEDETIEKIAGGNFMRVFEGVAG
jgi:membrane dipeptidase